MNINALWGLTSLLVPLALFSAEPGEVGFECDQCHGQGGVSITSQIPTIAGQPSAYIEASLRSYQQWERPCIKAHTRNSDGGSEVTSMCKVSEALNDDEIDALARHYATLEFIPAKQPFDASLVEYGGDLHEIHCETCHIMGGSIAARGPRLGGQWAEYLRTAIGQSISGEHLAPPVMERRLIEFSKGDINALVNYYASQQ